MKFAGEKIAVLKEVQFEACLAGAASERSEKFGGALF
jgi:hypothetical protein